MSALLTYFGGSPRSQIAIIRRFSTCMVLQRPSLSDKYKSTSMWDTRLNCKYLSDEQFIKSVNNKMMFNTDLSNLELDAFVNISDAEADGILPLQESVSLVKKFRRSLHAHRLLPSTTHAFCRLFLQGDKLQSLLNALEHRATHGIFPDFFAMNLILDAAISSDNYAIACRVAGLIMHQEEFGANPIADRLSLYALSKYIETKTDFADWNALPIEKDPVQDPTLDGSFNSQEYEDDREDGKQEQNQVQDEEEEDEDEAEYVRVPFLRNEYFDDHFDLKNPRAICGKSFLAVGKVIMKEDPIIGHLSQISGFILRGHWSKLINYLSSHADDNIDLTPLKDLPQFYIDNLHDIDAPSDEERVKIMKHFGKSKDSVHNFSQFIEDRLCKFDKFESDDIEDFKRNLIEWSRQREILDKTEQEKEYRRKLREEIEAKKRELKRKEQYYYFYDNLKKNRLTRIEYD